MNLFLLRILGAAYGLAGFIKGLGILAVKQYNVLTELTDAIQDKTNAKRREGLFEEKNFFFKFIEFFRCTFWFGNVNINVRSII
jgi:hypothetical protein